MFLAADKVSLPGMGLISGKGSVGIVFSKTSVELIEIGIIVVKRVLDLIVVGVNVVVVRRVVNGFTGFACSDENLI